MRTGIRQFFSTGKWNLRMETGLELGNGIWKKTWAGKYDLHPPLPSPPPPPAFRTVK